MRIHQIRNATLRIDFGGKTFLIDPMLSQNGEALSEDDDFLSLDLSFNLPSDIPLPLPPKDIIKNIDAVILTHLHPDHFDKSAEELLPKNTKIFVQDIFDKNALEKSHFNNIEVLSENGTKLEEVTIYKTHCMHGIREQAEPIFLANGMRWEAMGVIFKSENEPTLYVAGDTIWYEGIEETIKTFNPDYIVVNSSGAKIGRDYKTLMDIEDIKKLHEFAPNIKIIASHLDCIGNKVLSRKDLQNSEVGIYTLIPTDGELMIFER